MEPAALILFAGIYAVAVISPGPGVAAVVARSLATGARRSWPFVIGMVAGDLAWFGFVAAGLAVVAQTFHVVFAVIKYAGAAYLLYLAWKLWTAPAAAAAEMPYVRGEGVRLAAAGLAMTLGNPKTMVFFLAILPQVVALERITPLAIAELCAIMAVILSSCMMGYALLADRARRFVASPRAMQRLNRATGGLMAGVAVTVATR